MDGPWVPHENESSIFTVVIYLNSDFQGGTTKFISEEKPGEFVNVCVPECIIDNYVNFQALCCVQLLLEVELL